MPRKTNANYRHTLQVPAENVEAVADRILANPDRLRGHYDGRMEQTYHESCRPPRLEVDGVEVGKASVAVVVTSEDVRVNALSDALAEIIPADLGVRVPHWG